MKFFRFTYFLFLSLSSVFVFSQMGGSGSGKRLEKTKFMPVPYLSYDRSQEWQFGVVPMLMYNLNKKDTISPSSVSGGMAYYTTTGTWFTMIFNKLYLKEDKYRLKILGGLGDYSFQFYREAPIGGGFINYQTGTAFAFVEAQRRILPHFYFGINYLFARLNTTYEIEALDNPTSEVDLHGLGLILTRDKRNDVYYPTKGYQTNLKYHVFPGLINEGTSQKMELDLGYYHGLRKKKDVLAGRAFVGWGLGELDFNQQFVVGQNDIRGYSQGVFRGNQLIALQGEYRWNPFDKVGFVGFIGSAMVFNGVNDSDNGRLLPGAGAGFRINVFPENHMNVGLDAGVGIDDWSISFQIGESF